jgi:hypothetical protein
VVITYYSLQFLSNGDTIVEVFQDVLDKLSDVGEKGQAIEIL